MSQGASRIQRGKKQLRIRYRLSVLYFPAREAPCPGVHRAGWPLVATHSCVRKKSGNLALTEWDLPSAKLPVKGSFQSRLSARRCMHELTAVLLRCREATSSGALMLIPDIKKTTSKSSLVAHLNSSRAKPGLIYPALARTLYTSRAIIPSTACIRVKLLSV